MTGKRKWIIVSFVGTAVLLISGIIGGVVYAQSGSSTSSTAPRTSPMTTFADKVAAILKLDNATVENAFNQAQSDMQKEKAATQLKQKEAQIDQMVTDGKLTQEQATQYKTWLESKPGVNIPGLNNFDGGFGRGMGGQGGFGRGHGNNIPATTTTPTPSTSTN